MALYILFGIVALIIVVSAILFRKDVDGVGATYSITFLTLMAGGFLWLLMSFLIRFAPEPRHDYGTPIEFNKYERQIVSIKGSSFVSGSFLLGCGTINSSRYYVYYEKTEGGGFQQEKINVNRAIIFEEENCKPRIKWEGKKYTCSEYWLPKWAAPTTKEFYTKRLIYVPKGTIIQEFKLN